MVNLESDFVILRFPNPEILQPLAPKDTLPTTNKTPWEKIDLKKEDLFQLSKHWFPGCFVESVSGRESRLHEGIHVWISPGLQGSLLWQPSNHPQKKGPHLHSLLTPSASEVDPNLHKKGLPGRLKSQLVHSKNDIPFDKRQISWTILSSK